MEGTRPKDQQRGLVERFRLRLGVSVAQPPCRPDGRDYGAAKEVQVGLARGVHGLPPRVYFGPLGCRVRILAPVAGALPGVREAGKEWRDSTASRAGRSWNIRSRKVT